MDESKGQIYLIDILVSLLIISMVIALAVSFSTIEIKNSNDGNNRNTMLENGLSVTELLVGSAGVPSDWETQSNLPISIESLGLATQIGSVTYKNEIDVAKVDAFLGIDYNTSKELMGMGTGEDYYFNITYENGTLLILPDGNGTALAEKGTDAPNANNSYIFTRYGTLNGTNVIVGLKVYD